MPVEHLPTGIDLYAECRGEGEALVLIPGTGFGGDVWLPFQVPDLSRSMRVITFDQRGVGRTTHYKGVYRVEQMACDTIALMDRLGVDSAHVVGHSMGGRIGLEMALTYPDRVRSLVLAAAGSGVAGFAGRDCVQGLPELLATMLVEMGLENFVRYEVFDSSTYFTDDFRARCPERVQAFWDLVWPTHARLEEYIRLCIARHTWEATNRLGDVTVPVLVAVGDLDTIGRNHVPQAELLAERIPGAELRIIGGQTHGFFWEKPEDTNAWIREWVSRHS